MSGELIATLLGYAFGSVPFGLLLTKAAGLGDVRNIGSGNIGATNVLRTGNKKIAALTLLCDALKGTIPVLIAAHFLSGEASIWAGLGAMAGHIFPVWLRFKGGKGVATYIGVLFGLFWPLGLAFLAIWLAIAFLSRTSSLSALIASAIMPVIAHFAGRPDLAVAAAVMGAVIWVMHRANIRRLLKGEEPRIDLGKKG
jgi:acyl phosphate:glycerol-3-phosphate acyltransferase